MAQPGEFNTRVDIRNDYVFFWVFKENDGTPIDISPWSFNFKLLDGDNNVIWNVINADFGRPETGAITFTKNVFDLAGLLGLYYIELLVTKAGVLNDTYVLGTWEFYNV